MTAEHDLTTADFNALFDTFTTHVCRLEALPAYAVGGAEQERLDAFHAGRPRPLRNVATDPWLARIALSTINEGKRWTRVRVVDDPLTDYQRYQLASYRESQAAGESVRLVYRSSVGDVGPDFWLFDSRIAVVMHYSADGRPERRELDDDPERVAMAASWIHTVSESATPLNEFLAAHDG